MSVNSSEHFAELGLLLILECVKDLLDAALLREFVKSHNLFYRQPPPEFPVKGIVMVKVIIRLWHLKKTLSADELFALDKTVQTSPAVTRIKEGNEILDNSVGR